MRVGDGPSSAIGGSGYRGDHQDQGEAQGQASCHSDCTHHAFLSIATSRPALAEALAAR